MNKTGKRVLVGIGITVLATTLIAGGRHLSGDAEYRLGWIVHKITQELELTEQQKTKLEQVRDRLMVAKQQVHGDKSDRTETVMNLLSQPQLDQEKILALINEHTQGIRDQAPMVIEAAGQFYDSLNDEQREMLREHIVEKMAHHHGHSG